MKVIAESAFNHNGSLEYLKKLALESKDSSADFFTVQVMDVPSFCVKDYSKYGIYKENTLNFIEWKLLLDYCEKINLQVLPCVLDIKSLKFCYDEGYRFLKIHATDITNIPLLDELLSLDKIKLILETQCATNLEINFAISKLGDRIECLMHGFSNYPTEIEDLNLNSLDYFKEYFPQYKIGLADHSLDVEKVPLMALAKNCDFFEKHITLSRNNRNFDYQVSLYPYEFRAMVSNIRHYENALGIKMKHPVKSEMTYRKIMYKKVLDNNEYKRSDNGLDYITHKIESFDIKNVGIALIARLKSKRLPLKVLKPFYDTNLISFLYKKLNLSKHVSSVFLATSNLIEDIELVNMAKENQINVFLGHPVSVIDRMLELAIKEKLGAIFRVTGDNPFTDINFIDEMISLMWANNLDYVRVNNVPFGISAELFSTKYLWELYLKMDNPMQSEYLTQFVLEDNSALKGCLDIETKIKDSKYINLSIDYPKDLERAYSLIRELDEYDLYNVTFEDIIEKIDCLEREDKDKTIKLSGDENIKFSDFLFKLENQDYKIRKKITY
ncbi:N-acetylneuraminate synthase family protein [Aestuariivivens sediminis]|uniref:N-acetylneuraminate synthase family protein n=1 Tax=Aestuariivivens sediminis TaxID=2913557 RepID=UPI001F574F69|nr:N-acetylneuraminate synthase family protein [Aestuariivivens sediminis]